MQKIVPNLWYNANAVEAAEFYASLLPRTSSSIGMYYPSEGLLDFQQPFAGEPLVVHLDVAGYRLSLINAGPEITPNPSISFTLQFHQKFLDDGSTSAEQVLRQVWEGFVRDGKVLMDLGAYPFSPLYGWVEDRYGISWQLSLAQQAEPAQLLTPSLLFAGAAQNLAEEAITFYSTLFEDSAVGQKVYYSDPTEPVNASSLMYSDFELAGQRFSAMDSGVAQDFTFSGGISLEVHCRDQSEIDRLWLALSAHPAEEQCGWLRDRYGVSWQIVPANMSALMNRPEAHAKLMKMGKIVIEDF